MFISAQKKFFFGVMACEKKKQVSALMKQLMVSSGKYDGDEENDFQLLQDGSSETTSSYVSGDVEISNETIMERFETIISKVSSRDYSASVVTSMFELIHDMKHLMDNRNQAYRLARLCVLCNLFDDAINICNKNNINSKLIFGNAESDAGLESLHFVPHPPVFSFSGEVEVPDFKRGECITFIQKTTKMEGVRARKIKPYDTIVIPHEAVKDHLCVLIFKYPEIINSDVEHPTGAVLDSVILMISKIQDLEQLEKSIKEIEENERLPMNCIYFYSSKDTYRPGIKRFRRRHGHAIIVNPFHSILVQYFFFVWSFKLVRNKEMQSFMETFEHSFVAIEDAKKSSS